MSRLLHAAARGSPDITFDDGSRGTYRLSEFAELFGYVARAIEAKLKEKNETR